MSFSVGAEELSELVKLTFDNTQASDIKSVVIPRYEKQLGGVDGLLASLDVTKETGVRSGEVELRRITFGVNKVDEERLPQN
mmetsp:Transcript_17875/g.49521  ORF Transcript_17875/g.49521 Transcript_17875/m.49521 type:complete len:82 (-) Transcript_17875:256-501(-)